MMQGLQARAVSSLCPRNSADTGRHRVYIVGMTVRLASLYGARMQLGGECRHERQGAEHAQVRRLDAQVFRR